MFAPMSDESRGWWRKLGRSAASKFVLATAAAIGTKIGEHIVDAFLGADEEDPEEQKPKEEGSS
jgi:hypothetical protein